MTRPVHLGGLGFTYKWNMGWMHDMLDYTKEDPVHRKWHHNKITFSMMYAYSEKFMLPFSHDEVVHGKRSMLDKMPGDVWQKHANLRALYGYMFVHPGKKLLFMGGEIGQWREWNHDWQLDWEVLGDPRHAGLQRWVRDLNRVYAQEAIAVGRRLRSVRLLVDRLQRSRAQHHRADARAAATQHRRHRRGRQLHAGATARLSARRAGRAARIRNCSTATLRCTAAATSATRARWTAEQPSHGHAYSLSLTVPPLGFSF